MTSLSAGGVTLYSFGMSSEGDGEGKDEVLLIKRESVSLKNKRGRSNPNCRNSDKWKEPRLAGAVDRSEKVTKIEAGANNISLYCSLYYYIAIYSNL